MVDSGLVREEARLPAVSSAVSVAIIISSAVSVANIISSQRVAIILGALRDLPVHHRLRRRHGRSEHRSIPHSDPAQLVRPEDERVLRHRPTPRRVPVQQHPVKVKTVNDFFFANL